MLAFRGALAALMILAACSAPPIQQDALVMPLAANGDPTRGREAFVSRDGGHCVLCHAVRGADVAGDVGPALDGIGARLTPGQIRQRIADISRVNPAALMPVFHRTGDLRRVASVYAGKPVLSAQQVEDLVAFLGTLR